MNQFQNKRQTEKRKANQKVLPTMMLVPLRQGSASEPSSEAQSEGTTPQFLLPLGKRPAGSRSPTMSGYQYVPVNPSAEVGQVSTVSKGKRPVLPGDQEEDTFFTGKAVSKETPGGEKRGRDDDEDKGVETELDLDRGS